MFVIPCLVAAAAVLAPASLAAQTTAPAAPGPNASYVGSSACQRCHAPIYERWRHTRMENVVRDPREHPDAIIPDLTRADPLVTFGRDQIAFVYGSKWKQRYFTKVGDDFYPLPAQWDVTHRQWRPYFVAAGTDRRTESAGKISESALRGHAMKPRTKPFALCLDNAGNEASLIVGKVYRTVPDARAAKDDLLRIIDESGEGYPFDIAQFALVDFPQAIRRKLLELQRAS